MAISATGNIRVPREYRVGVLVWALGVICLGLCGCDEKQEQLQLPEDIPGAYCYYLAECTDGVFNPFASREDCENALQAQIDHERLSIRNPDAIDSCITELLKDTDDCTWNLYRREKDRPMECAAVFFGDKQVGDDCTQDTRACDVDHYCSVPQQQIGGMNRECWICATVLGEGDGCFRREEGCGQRLDCHPAEQKCVPYDDDDDLAPVGQSCAEHTDCASMVCADGQCTGLPGEGSACLAIEDASAVGSLRCTIPLVCEDGVCSRAAFPRPEGAACARFEADHWPGLEVCEAGTYCRWDDAAGNHVCSAFFGEGQGPCTSNKECQQGLYCETYGSFCERYGEAGDSCESRACNPETSYCAGGPPDICHELVEVGGSCANLEGCVGDAFCDTETDPWVCFMPLEIGEACDNHWRCRSNNCYQGTCADPEVCVMP
jgi:hypothetical protein